MTTFIALVLGVAAWAGVAALAVAIAFTLGNKNQVVMFLPIIAAVAIAWGIGEVVTERTLTTTDEEV